jgi:tRNA(fMet)-specific endonuclease VapC
VIVLDTDTLSIVQRASSPEYDRLVAAAGEPVFVTIISFEEQMRGWLAYAARAKTPERQVLAYSYLQALVDDLRERPILAYDDRAAEEVSRLTKLKLRVGTMDLKIAGICLVHGAVRITRNLAHFRRVPGLRLEDWTKVV